MAFSLLSVKVRFPSIFILLKVEGYPSLQEDYSKSLVWWVDFPLLERLRNLSLARCRVCLEICTGRNPIWKIPHLCALAKPSQQSSRLKAGHMIVYVYAVHCTGVVRPFIAWQVWRTIWLGLPTILNIKQIAPPNHLIERES